MRNQIHEFGELWYPNRAIVNYKTDTGKSHYEHYTFNADGQPVNGCTLSLREASRFAQDIQQATGRANEFLIPRGLLPGRVLHFIPGTRGQALWYTLPEKRRLYFAKNLTIPSGEVSIPGLIWKATADQLQIYAFRAFEAQGEMTPLFHAPFFNLYSDGRVCMGTVEKKFSAGCALEDFIAQWENYFFGSYFTHLIGGHNPIKDMISLWQGLFATGADFPVSQLLSNGLTLKELLP